MSFADSINNTLTKQPNKPSRKKCLYPVNKIKQLIDIMSADPIMPEEKISQLKNELTAYHQNDDFLKCKTAGDIVKANLKQVLRKNLRLISRVPNHSWY